MEPIRILGSLAGLAFVSGLRLYSTVLAVGLGIRLGFLDLPPGLEQLRSLARTPVLVIAGAVYLVEFFADKIPWVDSLWDAVHTFIRPLGAGLLAATALGPVDPTVRLGAFLLCGGIAFSSHSAKAGTRLAVNQSPEPFSNIGLSLAEDGVVAAGVWLALAHPIVTLGLVLLCVGLILWLIPKLFGLFRRQAGRIREFARARFGRGEAPRPSS